MMFGSASFVRQIRAPTDHSDQQRTKVTIKTPIVALSMVVTPAEASVAAAPCRRASGPAAPALGSRQSARSPARRRRRRLRQGHQHASAGQSACRCL
jgi:hypothetical protein